MMANQIVMALAMALLVCQGYRLLRFPGTLPAALEQKLSAFFARNMWGVFERFFTGLLVYGMGIFALCNQMASLGEARPVWMLVLLWYLAVRLAAASALLWCRRCLLLLEG